jgi:autotransporter-associated beta strand protein
MKKASVNPAPRKFALAVWAMLAASSVVAQTTWNGTVSATNNWNDPALWTGGVVPNSAGASVLFNKDFLPSPANPTVVDLGGSTITVGRITMTDSVTSTAGRFNLANGTLVLDNAGSKPVFNYTTGSMFDGFVNVTLAGTQGFEKTGAGTIQIGKAYNSTGYTGVTKITQGGVRIDGNGALGDQVTGSGVELAGGTLYIRTGNTFALDNRAAFTDPAGTAKRDITVTAGTSATPTQIQVENNSTVVVTGNLTSNTGTFLRKVDVGTLTLAGNSNLLGVFEADQGTTSVTGTLNSPVNFIVAKTNPGTAGRTATLNWSGTGAVATGSASFIINDGGLNTSGTLTLTAGSLVVGGGAGDAGRLVVGGKGVGVANINGGTLTISAAKEVSIGSFFQFGGANGNGTLNVNGGTLEAQGTTGGFLVGYGQTDAAAGGAFAGTGTLNLNGGTLLTGRILNTGPGATGTIHFNGGTLKAGADNANWIRTSAKIGDGGATIDTNGYAITIARALEANGTGGLTKSGAGTLTLTAVNTYSGTTTITGGTLTISGNGTLGAGGNAITISGGTLDLASTNQNAGTVTLSGGTLTNGTVTSNTGFAGQSGTVSATLAGNGGLTKTSAGTLTLDNAHTYSGGTTIEAGTLALGTNGTLGSGNLTLSGGTLDLGGKTQTVGTLTLTGGSLINGGIQATHYVAEAGTIDATLAGSAALTKSGSGQLTLNGTNTFTGGTTVAGGTLRLDGQLSSAVVISGGKLTGPGRITATASVSADGRIAFHLPAVAAALQPLRVDQTVTFAEGATIELTGSDLPTGTTWTLVQAGSFAGPLPQVAAPTDWRGTLAVNGGELRYTLERAGLTETEAWRELHFGSSAVSALSAPTADPDADGRANLVEYALGLDPLESDGANAVTIGTDASRLTLGFSRRADPTLTYHVEASDTLGANWTTIWSSGGAQNTAETVTVVDTVPLSTNPTRFLRLRIETAAW